MAKFHNKNNCLSLIFAVGFDHLARPCYKQKKKAGSQKPKFRTVVVAYHA
jgi:hypothetical protein